jgi:hypothetical protein
LPKILGKSTMPRPLNRGSADGEERVVRVAMRQQVDAARGAGRVRDVGGSFLCKADCRRVELGIEVDAEIRCRVSAGELQIGDRDA